MSKDGWICKKELKARGPQRDIVGDIFNDLSNNTSLYFFSTFET